MSMNFSAMQYEKQFDSKKLRNWETAKQYNIGEPHTHTGFTTPVANDRGHLLPGVPRSADSPWGNFVGTWDIPCHAPGNYIGVSTGRAKYAQEKLERDAENYRKKTQETVDKKRRADECAANGRCCDSASARCADAQQASARSHESPSGRSQCASCRSHKSAACGCCCGDACTCAQEGNECACECDAAQCH